MWSKLSITLKTGFILLLGPMVQMKLTLIWLILTEIWLTIFILWAINWSITLSVNLLGYCGVKNFSLALFLCLIFGCYFLC